jgi:hypothetical protein
MLAHLIRHPSPALCAAPILCVAVFLVACGSSTSSGNPAASQTAGTSASNATTTAIAAATIAAIPTTFTQVPSTVSPGAQAQISVHTKPKARCELDIAYRIGAPGLDAPGALGADKDGNVTWSWTVNPNAPSGAATALVSCNYDVIQASFTVM